MKEEEDDQGTQSGGLQDDDILDDDDDEDEDISPEREDNSDDNSSVVVPFSDDMDAAEFAARGHRFVETPRATGAFNVRGHPRPSSVTSSLTGESTTPNIPQETSSIITMGVEVEADVVDEAAEADFQEYVRELENRVDSFEQQPVVQGTVVPSTLWKVGLSALPLIVLAAVGVSIGIPLSNNRDGDSTPFPKCFEDTIELQDAVDSYLRDPVVVAETYGPINDWCVGDIADFTELFSSWRNIDMVSFNENISAWNMSSAVLIPYMFLGAIAFNQNIAAWDTSRVLNMLGTFEEAKTFNQPIGVWNVSRVVEFASIFREATAFNQDITAWHISPQVHDLWSVFEEAAAFNQPVDHWDLAQVTVTSYMFELATSFNQDLSSWNTLRVTHMVEMFDGASAFNSDLGSWNVSNVILMAEMFKGAAAYNQDLSAWNVRNVADMARMFAGASSFNQSLCAWGDILLPNANVTDMFFNTACLSTSDPDLKANPPGPFCHPCN